MNEPASPERRTQVSTFPASLRAPGRCRAMGRAAASAALMLVALLAAGCASTPLPAERATRPPPPPPPVAAGIDAVAAAPAEPAPQRDASPPEAERPVAPPGNAAVEARFPDPSTADMFGPPADWSGQPLANAELRSRLRSLVNEDTAGHAAPTVGWMPIGQSQRGEPIDAVVVTLGADASAAGLAASGRPCVLFVAGQHGDEPAASQGLLILAGQLAAGRWKALLEQVNVVIVARANPDGAAAGTRGTADGTDLNRDHLLLRTPEARALAKLRRDVDPAVVVDAHEYPAAPGLYARLGAASRADALLQTATTANLPPFVAKAAEEWFRAPLAMGLKAAGLRVDWYHVPTAEGADPHVSMGNVRPNSLRNVVGLSEGVGLLVESRGADLGPVHWRRRLHTQVSAGVDVLRSAAAHAADLVKLRAFVGNEVAAQACTGVAVLETAPTASEYTLQLLDPQTGVDKPVVVTWDSALELRRLQTRPRPCGYWLAASQAPAVERLRLLGVRVQQLSEAGELRGETYRAPTVQPLAGAVEADAAIAASVAVARRRWATTAVLLDVPAGSYYVGLDQPLASLALAALEPDPPHSYVANGLVTNAGDIARVMLRPQIAATVLP